MSTWNMPPGVSTHDIPGNEPSESGIGEWYKAKEREAARLAAALQAARQRNAPADVIRRLERALEAARYVGD